MRLAETHHTTRSKNTNGNKVDSNNSVNHKSSSSSGTIHNRW